jgi:hypothetical protein
MRRIRRLRPVCCRAAAVADIRYEDGSQCVALPVEWYVHAGMRLTRYLYKTSAPVGDATARGEDHLALGSNDPRS